MLGGFIFLVVCALSAQCANVKRNAHPNVPMSALKDWKQSPQNPNRENAQHNPYQGYAIPDDDFVAIYPTGDHYRNAQPNVPFSLEKEQGSNGNYQPNPHGGYAMGPDFSKMFENMNIPNGDLPTGYATGPDTAPPDFSKMFENMNIPKGHLPTGDATGPDTAPPDFSKMFENMNIPKGGLADGNPFDFSKMFENLTSGLEPGMNLDMSALGDLDKMMANLTKTMDKLNGMGFPVNYTNADVVGNTDGKEVIVDKLDDMEERLEDLEDDVAALKNSQVSADGCPAGFVKSEETGNCYFVSEDQKSWSQALIACVKEHGAYMVNIETPEENLFLKNTLSSKTAKDDFYIGGRMRGKAFRWSHTNDKVRYTNWGPGEPNTDFETKERCMEIGFFNTFIGYHWRDVPCFFKKRYICEKSL